MKICVPDAAIRSPTAPAESVARNAGLSLKEESTAHDKNLEPDSGNRP